MKDQDIFALHVSLYSNFTCTSCLQPYHSYLLSWIFSLIFYWIDVYDVNCFNIDIEVDCIHCKSVKSIPTRFSATLWPTLKSGTRCYSTARALLGQVHRTVASSPNTRRQAPPPPLWWPPSRSSHSGRAPGRLTPTYTPCFPGWATSSTLAGWTGRLPRTIPNLCSPSITGRRVRPADPVPIAENTKWCCKEHKSVKKHGLSPVGDYMR